MFPLKECHAFMAAAQRAGYSYYKAAHNTSSAPPLHTHMEDSTLELVSGVFSRRYQGVLERIPHKALKGPVGPLSALCARFLSPLPKS